MKAGKQTTLGARATVTGVGVHSGAPASLTFHPAEANTGIVFIRLDAQGRPEREIRAHARYVTATELATVLGDDDHGPCVSTIEHIMATLCGLGVDNALIEIDGPEAPIMDGSAAAFVAAIDQAGVVALPAARRYTKVLKPIRVEKGESFGELTPYDRGFRVDVTIDFPHALIGQQSLAFDVEPGAFRREVSRARTFGFMRDVSRLWSAGYARGSSLENTVVVADDRLLNPEGLRFTDEFVRHKALDAIGDLALAGAPLLGAYKSVKGGHKLNHAILCALIADPTAWTVVEDKSAARARRSRGHAEIGGGIAVPAYRADLS
ncbi:MAG: UDP-3-O-acyl-N-acetylglucosamine deacetylase [Alphaproteobacteria bacterium]|nr:UDP-3-O-acyl-N-acetylglucosamine deacetylase [Alphaproteobacteria bacterium]